MFVIFVSFDLVPGGSSAFLELIKTNARQSLELEPGCEVFDILTRPAEPDHVDLYERYRDRGAFEQHCRLPHFLAFDAASRPLVAKKWAMEYDCVDLPAPS